MPTKVRSSDRGSESFPRSLAAQADVWPLHTLIIDGEEGEAESLLLVHLLGNFHGLLVVDVAAFLSLLGWVVVLEPLDLFLAEKVPHREPICVWCKAEL